MRQPKTIEARAQQTLNFVICLMDVEADLPGNGPNIEVIYNLLENIRLSVVELNEVMATLSIKAVEFLSIFRSLMDTTSNSSERIAILRQRADEMNSLKANIQSIPTSVNRCIVRLMIHKVAFRQEYDGDSDDMLSIILETCDGSALYRCIESTFRRD